MPVAIGSTAPDFTLKSKTATGLVDVKLSANFGHKQTVLLFFPLAYTGVCTAGNVRPDQWPGRLREARRGRLCHQRRQPVRPGGLGQDQQDRGHPAVGFEQGNVTKAYYGVLFPMLAGIGDTAARAAFVIGKDGVVKYAEQTATPKDLPNFLAVKAALAG